MQSHQKAISISNSNTWYLQISPIQNTVYLASMAVIAGARAMHQIRATVRAGFLPVMKVSWITSPLCLAFAQKFLPEQTWVPFFNIVSFIIGTYINAHTKKKRLAALRRKVCPSNTLLECKLIITIALWGRTKRFGQARRLRKARLLNRRRDLRLERDWGSGGAKSGSI